MHHENEEGYFGKHILQENVVWESNLIPDIASVNYLAGHQERTKFELLELLPVFFDDLNVYGPLRNAQTASVRGRVSCTPGEEGSRSLERGGRVQKRRDRPHRR